MEETKTIMSHATINSLVIMDELGRGTSTHDGNIIAKTILDRLEKRLKCRTLFTTHYHGLKDWCSVQPGIDLCFMDCMVNDDSRDITFLYKFKRGVCPQSYGIHVAKLAGLPVNININF
jgi:DNA mismatch repair protein MSH6